MDKKYQKIATPVLCFLAVFLLIGLPLLVQAQTSVTDGSISHTDVTTVGAFAGETWYQILMQWVIGGFGTLVAMIGWALDWSIQNFILGFGEKYQSSNLGDTINSLWGMVRDIFNLTFIFGLIFIGFKMILDAGDSHARHTLVSLIGAALLVNFSLFITKFVVDFSDLAAYKIFEAFKSNTSETASISVAFANLLGVSSLFDNGSLANAGAAGSLLYLTGSLLVLLVLAYVYLAGAVLIAIRFVVLTIYLVFSPVMFLGWVFPSMHKRSEDYWHGFLGQAFFAPAFLFMLYLSYRIVFTYNDQIQKHVFDSGGGYFNRGSFTQADSMIPFFIMTITFLIASMVVAKNMGAVGAGSVIKVGNQLRGGAQGILYRNTGGRLAKGALNVMDSSGISNLPGTRTLRSVVKSGYEYGAGGTSLAKVRSEIKSEKSDITENRSRMFKEEKSEKRKKIISAGTADGATQAQTDAMQREAAGVSSSDLEYMSQAQRLAIAPYLNDSTVEDFGKSEKVDAASISEFKKTRSEYIKNSIKENGVVLTSEFSKLTLAQLEAVGEEFILANAEHLTLDQVKSLKGSKKFATGQIKNIEDTRRAAFTNGRGFTQGYRHYGANNQVTIRDRHRDPKEIAAMPTSALLSTNHAQFMNSRVLKEIEKNNNLELTERETIANNILQDPTGNVDGRKYLATSKVINDGYWG